MKANHTPTFRTFIYLCASILCTVSAWAGPVDVETARQQAAAFFSQQPSTSGKHKVREAKQMRLLHVQQNSPEEAPLLYVFGDESGSGYTVIAGDDAASSPVLGYSATSTFTPDNIPCCLRYWLDAYGQQIATARQTPPSARKPIAKAKRVKILPLIVSKWNQSAPYNNLCPIDQNTGKRCVTGCVATAMAQIMYYHKWPITGTGSHSYVCQGKNLSANFGATTYQWDKMKDTYGYNESDPSNAVATLMYQCGVAVEMKYTSEASSASLSSDILTQYFRYSARTANDFWVDGDINTLEDILYRELYAERPVLISGQGDQGGHQFICDGYNDGYFHFNFGWGGWEDDYFLLTAIDTDNGSFNEDLFITYGIQKPGEEQTIDGIRYEFFPDGTAIILKGTATGDYTVPSTVTANEDTYTVVGIDDGAFANNTGLTSVTIPASILSVGSRAFAECTSLKKVTLQESETAISFGGEVFSIGESWTQNVMEEANIGRTVVGGTPFEAMTKLQTVTLGKEVTNLPMYFFESCSSLQSLHLPAKCKTIGEGAFAYCDLLKVTVDSSNPYLYTQDDVLFQKEGGILLFYPNTKEDESYTVPNNVKEIASYAIQNQKKLKHLVISEGVTTTGWYSIASLSYLEDITLPASLTDIDYGYGLIYNCRSLKSITVAASNPRLAVVDGALLDWKEKSVLAYTAQRTGTCQVPEGIQTIEDYAFYSTKVTHLILPSTLTDIGWYSLYTRQMEDLYVYASTPPDCDGSSSLPDLEVSDITPTIYVPWKSVERYQSTEPWSNYKIQGTDLPDAIESIQADDKTATSTRNGDKEVIYDLHGHRIKQVTHPGIYIKNGQKIFIR